ncbi:hypothetical protein [Achromobacter phage ehaak_LB5]|nr:hypothetical protein [Achromobacter phage ehaak_LB5]
MCYRTVWPCGQLTGSHILLFDHVDLDSIGRIPVRILEELQEVVLQGNHCQFHLSLDKLFWNLVRGERLAIDGDPSPRPLHALQRGGLAALVISTRLDFQVLRRFEQSRNHVVRSPDFEAEALGVCNEVSLTDIRVGALNSRTVLNDEVHTLLLGRFRRLGLGGLLQRRNFSLGSFQFLGQLLDLGIGRVLQVLAGLFDLGQLSRRFVALGHEGFDVDFLAEVINLHTERLTHETGIGGKRVAQQVSEVGVLVMGIDGFHVGSLCSRYRDDARSHIDAFTDLDNALGRLGRHGQRGCIDTQPATNEAETTRCIQQHDTRYVGGSHRQLTRLSHPLDIFESNRARLAADSDATRAARVVAIGQVDRVLGFEHGFNRRVLSRPDHIRHNGIPFLSGKKPRSRSPGENQPPSRLTVGDEEAHRNQLALDHALPVRRLLQVGQRGRGRHSAVGLRGDVRALEAVALGMQDPRLASPQRFLAGAVTGCSHAGHFGRQVRGAVAIAEHGTAEQDRHVLEAGGAAGDHGQHVVDDHTAIEVVVNLVGTVRRTHRDDVVAVDHALHDHGVHGDGTRVLPAVAHGEDGAGQGLAREQVGVGRIVAVFRGDVVDHVAAVLGDVGIHQTQGRSDQATLPLTQPVLVDAGADAAHRVRSGQFLHQVHGRPALVQERLADVPFQGTDLLGRGQLGRVVVAVVGLFFQVQIAPGGDGDLGTALVGVGVEQVRVDDDAGLVEGVQFGGVHGLVGVKDFRDDRVGKAYGRHVYAPNGLNVDAVAVGFGRGTLEPIGVSAVPFHALRIGELGELLVAGTASLLAPAAAAAGTLACNYNASVFLFASDFFLQVGQRQRRQIACVVDDLGDVLAVDLFDAQALGDDRSQQFRCSADVRGHALRHAGHEVLVQRGIQRADRGLVFGFLLVELGRPRLVESFDVTVLAMGVVGTLFDLGRQLFDLGRQLLHLLLSVRAVLFCDTLLLGQMSHLLVTIVVRQGQLVAAVRGHLVERLLIVIEGVPFGFAEVKFHVHSFGLVWVVF